MHLVRLIALLILAGCASGEPQGLPAGACTESRLEPDAPLPEGFALLDMAAYGDSLKAMDHSIVVDDHQRLHLFWTRGMDWIAGEGRDFGHASTADLVQWEFHPRIRLGSAAPGIDHQWAPQVVREGGQWRMYFTGVQNSGKPEQNRQRIFASTSPDLLEWSEPELVLEPRFAGIAWGDGSDWSGDARDQFVFLEGGQPRMLLTVRLDSGRQSLAVAAQGPDGWAVERILDSIQGDVIESPFLIRAGATLYLFLNNWQEGGQQVWTATQLAGPWSKQRDDFRGFAFEMLPLDEDRYLVSHVFGPGILFTQMRAPEFTFTNQVYPRCPDGNFSLPRRQGLVEISRP